MFRCSVCKADRGVGPTCSVVCSITRVLSLLPHYRRLIPIFPPLALNHNQLNGRIDAHTNITPLAIMLSAEFSRITSQGYNKFRLKFVSCYILRLIFYNVQRLSIIVIIKRVIPFSQYFILKKYFSRKVIPKCYESRIKDIDISLNKGG